MRALVNYFANLGDALLDRLPMLAQAAVLSGSLGAFAGWLIYFGGRS